MRRTRPWQAASKVLKERSPELWQSAVDAWAEGYRRTEPVRLARDRVLSAGVGRRSASDLAGVERFVLFVGYPRSGHTLVASMLNAHPAIVIGHRLRVLSYLAAGFGRDQVYGMVLLADRRFGRRGRIGSKRYDYSVPGQWQGRYRDLRVVGDGDVNTGPLTRRPDLLERLRETTGALVPIIHVVRNPFDNITTLAIRNRMSLEESVDRYFAAVDRTVALRDGVRHDGWLDVRHEEVISDPSRQLKEVCGFLGVEAPDGWAEACASIVYRKPRATRTQLPWSPELVAKAEQRMVGVDFLAGYNYELPEREMGAT